jgi:dTDP-4-dehydrorhamnose 3,5-epimerase
MHFQKGQAKLINVISGVIFDVFVDIRQDCPTFGKWHGVVLDAQKKEMLLIPDGFAHGFYVLSDHAHVVYKVSALYDPALEKSFHYNDTDVAIDWPIGEKILSQRDLFAKKFKEVCS